MDCSSFILDENTLDFIVARDEMEGVRLTPKCVQPINEEYAIWYYDGKNLPPLSIQQYTYTAIPKLFWLMDSTAMEVSGIIALQNQPALGLKGEGVLIGIIDTGIDYTNPLFQYEDGSTRIISIWDQGYMQPNGNMNTFQYGAFYSREQINEALKSTEPKSIVPLEDELGHGTYLASLAAGGVDEENDFTGAAPLSELVIVKLKQAKQNIRKFFYFPEEEPLFQENDIMAAVAYLEQVAEEENKPLVILLGLGSNQGSHIGTGPLSTYLNDVGLRRGRAIVIAAGNEANTQHHFYGEAKSLLEPVAAEINVGSNIEGFCMEMWCYAPEQVRVLVQSPTGQRSQGGFPVTEETQTTNFVFENTTLTINYRVAGRSRRDLLVFFRFSQPSAGVWTVYIYPQNAITGAFHMWLPIQPQQGSDVTFLLPNPDTTITTPSTANVPMTVGGYDGLTEAIYIESGRGFDGLGRIKPDFCAPAVNVFGVGRRGGYVRNTGTSAAAAIAAGASAQCLEWGVLRANAPGMNSVEVKNLLVRGCNRDNNVSYPSEEWGYGRLDVFRAFQILRE